MKFISLDSQWLWDYAIEFARCSTLQWGVGRGLLWVTPAIVVVLVMAVWGRKEHASDVERGAEEVQDEPSQTSQ